MSSRKMMLYILMRVIILFITVVTAYSLTFLLLKFMPLDAVDFVISQFITSPAAVYQDPIVINTLKEGLYDLFGLKGTLLEQYISFLRRVFIFDFGPSIISFPTPVTDLIRNALPWTIGLLSFTTLMSWIIGNLLGTITTFIEIERGGVATKFLQSIAIVLYPIPYYIMALVLIFLLTYLIPIFPLPGAGGIITFEFSFENIINIIRRFALPALSILIISAFGWNYISSRTLTLNIVSEDFSIYAKLRALPDSIILKKYILRNILISQITILALHLGMIFSGALLVEVIFALPGLGTLLYKAINSGDISTALGVLSLSIVAVSVATFIIDLIYPIIDPRVRHR
uniref:ABC transporter permease n=1 Tax=Ignisphaera aggregans TaxID=334771 RepID=A0A7C5UXQ9_9CREN